MANDFRQFSLQLDTFVSKVNIAANLAATSVAYRLFRRLVQKTPVRTGRARASWTLAVRQADRRVAPPGRKSYPPPKTPVIKPTLGEEVWLSNNLAYITALEDGHSKQAPHGMVRLAVLEEQQQLDAVVRASTRLAGL